MDVDKQIDIEKRIKKLEEAVFGKQQKQIVSKKEESYKGPSGGLKLLISESFFNVPRSFKEFHSELQKKAYHYNEKTTEKALRDAYNKKLLTRVGKKGDYKYVVRK